MTRPEKQPASCNGCNLFSASSVVAGYVSGCAGIVVGHPLDSIKVLLQTQSNEPPRSRVDARPTPPLQRARASMTGPAFARASMSTSSASSLALEANASQIERPTTTIGKRTLRSLYAGIPGPLLTSGILQSLNFAVYDSSRRFLYQIQEASDGNYSRTQRRVDDYLHYDSLRNVALSGAAAGAFTSVFTSPMIITKTKQQLQNWSFKRAALDTYRRNGFRGYYMGFGLHFTCDCFGRAVYMLTYESMKRQLARRKGDENISLLDRIASAAAAGMICWASIFPFDLVRSKLYMKSFKSDVPPSTLDGILLAREMVVQRGWTSLYRGVGVTVARAGPVAAVILPVYDTVLANVS
mmetsp:Transcript_12999/g.29662  ORF Transcript_12999/g.29662 Transcript_12999/m.29662 type:complete len:353 (+) Transcript_12999:193-1251(+)